MSNNNVCIPLHFFRNVTLEQYYQFFEDCPVCASVEDNEEFANTGAYVLLDYYSEDHKMLMKYIKKNSGIVEIDMERLAEMKD